MKLLICTQAIDSKHPVLGFFHRWVEEFAKHYDHVHVICLYEGEHHLPENVTVHSLGKEDGQSRLKYLYRFYKYTWQLRKEYDAVFVHMNQEYVLLAGILWRILGKKIVLWRNHYSGNILTEVACVLANDICYTSESSYTQKFKKSHKMPIGIDTDLFKPLDIPRTQNLLYVGRIAESKRVLDIVKAFEVFCTQQGYAGQSLTIAGSSMTPADENYHKKVQEYVSSRKLNVTFTGPVTQSELPKLYSSHFLCINLSRPGMFDKVLGEALACGCRVLTTNSDLDKASQVCMIDDKDFKPEILAVEMIKAVQKPFSTQEAREYVIEHHSLQKMVLGLVKEFNS